MFQDYMRSRLGLSGSNVESPHFAQANPTPSVVPQTQPVATPSGVPATPAGFNPMPYHPSFNPTGWPGHPMNRNMETPNFQPISNNPMGAPGNNPPVDGQNTVNPRFNPYAF